MYSRSSVLPLPTQAVISSLKAIRLERYDLPFVNPGWLFAITFLSFTWLELASRRICSRPDSTACNCRYICFWRWEWCLGFSGISNLFWRLWPFEDDGDQLCQHSQRHSHPWFYLACTSSLWTSCWRSPFTQASWLSCLFYILYIGMLLCLTYNEVLIYSSPWLNSELN